MQTKTLKSDLLLLRGGFIWGTTFVAQTAGDDLHRPHDVQRGPLRSGGPDSRARYLLIRAGRDAGSQAPKHPLSPVRRGPGRSGPVRRGLDAADRTDLHHRRKGQLHHQSLRGARSRRGPVPWAAVRLGGLGGCGARRGRPVPADHHESFTIGRGDLFIFIGAFFWTVHVHLSAISPSGPILYASPASSSSPVRSLACWRRSRSNRSPFPPSAPPRSPSSTAASSRPGSPSLSRSSASEPPPRPRGDRHEPGNGLRRLSWLRDLHERLAPRDLAGCA